METAHPLASAPSALESGHTTVRTVLKTSASDSSECSESPRLFIVCGRDRKVEQVRELFACCGAIRQLHLATDRSNKSRGFAFLQYEDAASAADAIQRFDKTTLSDGHVLKVTVAREKTRATASSSEATQQPGKLKRNQHSQEDSGDKGNEGSTTNGGGLPGKRQRSSPPSSVVALTTGPTLQKVWTRASPFGTLAAVTRSAEDEIADVLGGIVAQIERLYGEVTEPPVKLIESVLVGAAPAAAKRKAPTALTLSAAERAQAKTVPGETSAKRTEYENLRPCKQKSQRTTAAQATPNGPARDAPFVRPRRHVAVDESDSSVDDASDASVGRRKRSSTEPLRVDPSAANARRRLSDLSELSLSPAGISSPMTSKKRCSRRSSASSSSSSLPPYHGATTFRPVAPLFVPTMPPPSSGPPPMRRRRLGPRAKLFFTSTVKFTTQEVEAMFSVYEQLEHVHLIKSFGRVKTMAYIKYASPEAASSVLASFVEDNEGEDPGMMNLVFADTDEPTARFAFLPSKNDHTSGSAAGESTSSETVTRSTDAELVPRTSSEDGWLMILYDRGLTNEAISSCVAACEGMEFVDIKMFRSTGESQGVAFVKFETVELAHAASQQLHNSEFPTGSRKFLQAIVIADPALFSTPHGASLSAISAAQSSSQHPVATTSHHPGEDGDLGFVEARFAHLMSGASDQQPSTAANPIAVPVDEGYDEQGQYYPSQRTGGFTVADAFVQHAGLPLPPQHDGPAPYGYFQVGQPYPYTTNSHMHRPLAYRQPPLFFPPGGYSEQHAWGYDNAYPLWPGDAGSPMPPDYNPYSWEPASTPESFSNAPAQSEVTSVFVSSSRPLDLSCLMKAIQECPGVVGFNKEERDGVAFVVDFGEPRLAAEAASKLDGTMCNGNKLRVAVAGGHRPPPSRRKRQRLDQRGRRK